MIIRNERIYRLLRYHYDAAAKHHRFMSREFVKIIQDVPSGLPYTDGQLRVTNSSKALHAAHDELLEAMLRLKDYEISGIVPPDLKDELGKPFRAAIRPL